MKTNMNMILLNICIEPNLVTHFHATVGDQFHHLLSLHFFKYSQIADNIYWNPFMPYQCISEANVIQQKLSQMQPSKGKWQKCNSNNLSYSKLVHTNVHKCMAKITAVDWQLISACDASLIWIWERTMIMWGRLLAKKQ